MMIMILSGSPVRLSDGRLGHLVDPWVWTDEGNPVQLASGEVVYSSEYEYAESVHIPERIEPGPATDLFFAEVAHGVAWLDDYAPEWRTKVNWAILDMYLTTQDIVAQLGIDTSDLSRNKMVRLGWYVSIDQIHAHWPPPQRIIDAGRESYEASVWYGAMQVGAYNHLTRAWFHFPGNRS